MDPGDKPVAGQSFLDGRDRPEPPVVNLGLGLHLRTLHGILRLLRGRRRTGRDLPSDGIYFRHINHQLWLFINLQNFILHSSRIRRKSVRGGHHERATRARTARPDREPLAVRQTFWLRPNRPDIDRRDSMPPQWQGSHVEREDGRGYRSCVNNPGKAGHYERFVC